MSYYEDKKALTRDISNWCYDENRGSWASLMSKVALKYGFTEKLALKILEQISEGKLYIDNDELKTTKVRK